MTARRCGQPGIGLPDFSLLPLGTTVVGLVAAGLTLGLGQVLLAVLRSLWAKLAVAAAFVAPAGVAGYHAVHGVVKHTMPSEAWQIAFSIIAVGITAFLRVAEMAAGGPTRPVPGGGRPAGAGVILVPKP